jgi:hypothetical protein
MGYQPTEAEVDREMASEPHLRFVTQTLDRNVFFYPRHLWDEAFQKEVLDRGLFNPTDIAMAKRIITQRKEKW